jgi:hypothetical protein
MKNVERRAKPWYYPWTIYGLVWFGLVWFGLVWSGLVWIGLDWSIKTRPQVLQTG